MAKWVKTKFDSEIKNFTAIANKIAGGISQQELKRNLVSQMIDDFKKKYNAKTMQDIKSTEWKMLQGSDSWLSTNMNVIEKNIKKSEMPKLYEAIVNLLSGNPVPTPIIMMQNNVGMLISGEYIMIACRLLNIEPKVVMF